MPQDKRRSISYRSFVTCDDPKGIECGAIRKSKINNYQKKEQDTSIIKVETNKNKEKNHNTFVGLTTIIKEEKEKKEMVVREITRGIETSPVTFQLLEVSKEANKLNHVINSWSNDDKFEGFENNSIAKDLLKGALDLQESLTMLGKLQDASNFVLGLPRKERQRLKDGRFDGMVGDVRGFERYERSSVGLNGRYSRRNSSDEMRSVVRDSLLRQNVMITNPVFEECYYDHHRKMASPDMLPSTSSSQSSNVYSSNFVPSDSSVSSSAHSQKKKGKDSNLIVKLMGLESFPSSPRRRAEKEKILNLAKPVYDNDSPRAKRPQFGVHEECMKQRSVEEILENLKFKGLLRNGSVNGLTIYSQESEVFCPRNSCVDEKPPIVVMKPIRYPCLDLDGPYMPKFWGENIMKPRRGTGSAQEIVRKEAVSFKEKYETSKGFHSEDKSKSNKKVTLSKVRASVNSQPKLQRKQAEVKKVTEVEKVTPIKRKGDEKKDAAKSSDHLISRDQEKCTTLKIRRQENGKSISKNQTFNPQKMGSTTTLDIRKRGNSERKKNRQPALVVEDKRICEETNKKREVIYKEDNDTIRDSNLVLSSVNSIIAIDNDKERCQIPIRDYDLDSETKMFVTPEELSYLPSDKKTSHYDDNQSSYSEITSVSTSEHCSIDRLGEIQSPLREVTLITTHENGIAVHHDTYQDETACLKSPVIFPQANDSDSLRQCVTPREHLKALLLSNITWANRVEELFNIQVSLDLVPFVIDDGNHNIESSRLLIDCANEALELKFSQFSQARLPLPQMYTTTSQSSPSLDCLLEEVCNGIEDLRSYSRPISDDFPSDNLYGLLDQDLRLKSGIWGIGWRSMYTQDEVEQVIGEVDRFVVNKLIEEVLLDLIK